MNQLKSGFDFDSAFGGHSVKFSQFVQLFFVWHSLKHSNSQVEFLFESGIASIECSSFKVSTRIEVPCAGAKGIENHEIIRLRNEFQQSLNFGDRRRFCVPVGNGSQARLDLLRHRHVQSWILDLLFQNLKSPQPFFVLPEEFAASLLTQLGHRSGNKL